MKIMYKVVLASFVAAMLAGCASAKVEEEAAAEETVIEQTEEAVETVQSGIGYEK